MLTIDDYHPNPADLVGVVQIYPSKELLRILVNQKPSCNISLTRSNGNYRLYLHGLPEVWGRDSARLNLLAVVVMYPLVSP